MNRGCLFGCLGAVLLGLIIVVVGIFALDAAFNVFEPAPRVDLAQTFGPSHAVMVVVDPNADFIVEAVSKTVGRDRWFIDFILPHEMALIIDADLENNSRELTAAVSTKRLGGMLSWYLPTPNGWKIADDLNVNDVTIQDNGVFVLTASGALDETGRQDIEDDWPGGAVEPISIDGGHTVEIIMNNTDGAAYAALAGYLDEQVVEGNPADAPDEEPAIEDELRELFWNGRTTRITYDLLEAERLESHWEIQCATGEAATTAEQALTRLFDKLRESVAEENVTVEFEVARTDTTITADATWINFVDPFVDRAERQLEQLEAPQTPPQ